MKELSDQLTPDTWSVIVFTAILQARRGDDEARARLSEYSLLPPGASAELQALLQNAGPDSIIADANAQDEH